MKTPEEEAKEIYNDFYLYSAHQNSEKARSEQAKYCSLKCVDWMIKERLSVLVNKARPKRDLRWKVLQSIRQAIEKM